VRDRLEPAGARTESSSRRPLLSSLNTRIPPASPSTLLRRAIGIRRHRTLSSLPCMRRALPQNRSRHSKTVSAAINLRLRREPRYNAMPQHSAPTGSLNHCAWRNKTLVRAVRAAGACQLTGNLPGAPVQPRSNLPVRAPDAHIKRPGSSDWLFRTVSRSYTLFDHGDGLLRWPQASAKQTLGGLDATLSIRPSESQRSK